MSLPPLPLIDGCLFIDNSFLELMACPRKLQYSQLEKKVPASDAPSLNYGTAIHLALAHRYLKHEPIEDLPVLESEQASLLEEHFRENPQPEGDHRDLNFAIEVIKKYNEHYEYEPFNVLTDGEGKRMVELSFALPLFSLPLEVLDGLQDNEQPISVIYTGRIDLPVSWNDQIIIIDHKTTGMLGSNFFDQYRMSSQLIGYCWAFQTLTGRRVNGFAVNAIRSKAKTMKLLNGTASKGEEVKWWSEGFFREKEDVLQWRIDEWKKNVIARIEEFFWHYSKGFMPMKTSECAHFGRCPYYDVCYYPPENRDIILESNQFRTNDWSPLNKHKPQPIIT